MTFLFPENLLREQADIAALYEELLAESAGEIDSIVSEELFRRILTNLISCAEYVSKSDLASNPDWQVAFIDFAARFEQDGQNYLEKADEQTGVSLLDLIRDVTAVGDDEPAPAEQLEQFIDALYAIKSEKDGLSL